MGKINQILQEYVNKDYTELVEVARGAIKNLLPTARVLDVRYDGMLLLSGVVLSAVAADGELSEKECIFLCEVLGVPAEKLEQFLTMYDASMIALTDDFADSLDAQGKTDVLCLVIAVAACDKKISWEENAFIRKIIE